LVFKVTHRKKTELLSRGHSDDLPEPTRLEVLHGLDELLLGVHDERPVAGERLTEGPACEQQQLGVLRSGELDVIAVCENRQLPRTHLATRDPGHTRKDRDEALEREVDALVDLRAR
jgi:hypothetical protein